MSLSQHRWWMIVPVAALSVLIIALAQVDRGTAAPEAQNEVDAGEYPELLELVNRDQRILFEATVTGDFSLYPTIYYNDPAVRMHSDYQLVMQEYGEEAKAALGSLNIEAGGGDSGYLTARIASLLSGQANMEAWESAKAKADSEDRDVTINDLPEGFTPIERPSLDDWVGQSLTLFDVKVGANTGSAKVAAGNPKAGGQILSYEFIQVDGQWYISYMESSWSQGDPDYLD